LPHLIKESRVFERVLHRLARIELVEHRHQHDTDNHPNRHVFKKIVQTLASLSQSSGQFYANRFFLASKYFLVIYLNY
jgi:hypothetical protein